METNKFNTFPLINGFITLVSAVVIAYVVIVIFSFGTLVFSGFYIALTLLSVGVIGFSVFVVLKTLGLFTSKQKETFFVSAINICFHFYTQYMAPIAGVEKIGDSTIVRHRVIEKAYFEPMDILFTILISLGLLALYYFFEKTSQSKNKE